MESRRKDLQAFESYINDKLEDESIPYLGKHLLNSLKSLLINEFGVTDSHPIKNPIEHLIRLLNGKSYYTSELLDTVMKIPAFPPRMLLQAINYASASDVNKFMQTYFGGKLTLLSGIIDFHLRMNHDDPLMLCWKILIAKDIKTLSNDELNQAFNYAERHQLKHIGMSILATQAAISQWKNEYLDNRKYTRNILLQSCYKNLSGADFSNCVIAWCHFKGSNFSGADLSNTLIHNTEIMYANFTSANLQNLITNERLCFANLTHANISGLRYQEDVFEQILRPVKPCIVPHEEEMQLALAVERKVSKTPYYGKSEFLIRSKFFTEINLLDLKLLQQVLNSLHAMTKDNPHHDDIAEAIADDLFDRIMVMRNESADIFTNLLTLMIDDFQPVLLIAYHHPLFAKQQYENTYDYAVSAVNSVYSFFSRNSAPLIETEAQAKLGRWMRN